MSITEEVRREMRAGTGPGCQAGTAEQPFLFNVLFTVLDTLCHRKFVVAWICPLGLL